MKKRIFIFIAFLSVLFISACSNDSNELSGKTFKVAYTPVLQEDVENPNKYDSIMTLEFSDGDVVNNTIDDTEGKYELNDDVLEINFDNENEALKINFSDFTESEKNFSSYSALISNFDLQIEDNSQVSKFRGLANKLSQDMPVEFIEE